MLSYTVHTLSLCFLVIKNSMSKIVNYKCRKSIGWKPDSNYLALAKTYMSNPGKKTHRHFFIEFIFSSSNQRILGFVLRQD